MPFYQTVLVYYVQKKSSYLPQVFGKKVPHTQKLNLRKPPHTQPSTKLQRGLKMNREWFQQMYTQKNIYMHAHLHTILCWVKLIFKAHSLGAKEEDEYGFIKVCNEVLETFQTFCQLTSYPEQETSISLDTSKGITNMGGVERCCSGPHRGTLGFYVKVCISIS